MYQTLKATKIMLWNWNEETENLTPKINKDNFKNNSESNIMDALHEIFRDNLWLQTLMLWEGDRKHLRDRREKMMCYQGLKWCIHCFGWEIEAKIQCTRECLNANFQPSILCHLNFLVILNFQNLCLFLFYLVCCFFLI